MLITAENSHLSFNKFNHLIKKSAGTLFFTLIYTEK